jgi:hypothetical protein
LDDNAFNYQFTYQCKNLLDKIPTFYATFAYENFDENVPYRIARTTKIMQLIYKEIYASMFIKSNVKIINLVVGQFINK